MSSLTFRANLGTGLLGLLLFFLTFVLGQPILFLLAAASLVLFGYLFAHKDEYGVPWWHVGLRSLSFCLGAVFVVVIALGVAVGIGAGTGD